MNSKIIMIASALFYVIPGIGLTFLPLELSEYLKIDVSQPSVLILQILGSVYLGFGMVNWMTKNNLLGGIYGRPLLIGNLVHFLVTAIALIKIVGHSENLFGIILTLTVIYSIFAVCFGYLLMTSPGRVGK